MAVRSVAAKAHLLSYKTLLNKPIAAKHVNSIEKEKLYYDFNNLIFFSAFPNKTIDITSERRVFVQTESEPRTEMMLPLFIDDVICKVDKRDQITCKCMEYSVTVKTGVTGRVRRTVTVSLVLLQRHSEELSQRISYCNSLGKIPSNDKTKIRFNRLLKPTTVQTQTFKILKLYCSG